MASILFGMSVDFINVGTLYFQYLKITRHLDGYGEVMFPHCACDSRKDGHVIAIAGSSCFKLQACKTDGTLEVSFSHPGL
jgi:hypothetical protein